MTRLPDAEWRTRPGLRRIVVVLSADGGAVKIVGGAVRDTLLRLPVTDIDLATPLLPQEVTRRLEAEMPARRARALTLTAVRETFEETGLPPERVEVLGALPIYTTGSAFLVTPVVGLVQPGFVLRPNPHEVDDVFEVPLDFLMNPANHRRHAVDWEGARREWYSMPYSDTTPDGAQERFIWGATAGMLRNFYRLLIA